MLQEQGLSPKAAALSEAMVGPMQVAGRIVEFALAHRVSPARAAGPFAAAGVLALAGGYRSVLCALIAVGIFSQAAFAMAVRDRGN